MGDASVRGRFVWHELYTPNPSGAHEFYGHVVGWKVQAWEQDPSYPMLATASGPVGATVAAGSGTPQWVPYIGTENVDETAEAATRLGGRIATAPTDIPSGGRYALLIDPQGATFGVHASASHQPETEPRAGEFSWHELATSVAPGIAFGFYGALFDWDEIEEHDMGPMGKYLVFGRNGRRLGGLFDQSAAGRSGAAYWLGYVSVADLEGAVERAKAARGSVQAGPMDVPGGDRIAQLMDPYGAFFALHKAAAESAAVQSTAEKRAKPAAAAKPAARQAARKRRPAKKAAKRAKPAERRAKSKPAAKKKGSAKKPAKKTSARTKGVSPSKRTAKKKAAKKKRRR
jgi:predicted enzyme related to lactoylglutathione lyase